MNFKIENLFKRFNDVVLFDNFSITLEKNATTCLLGPSGCGKTTLLNMIGGTVRPDSGELSGFRDTVISYIFQEPRLLPWRTVKQNIAFPLKDILPKERWEPLVTHTLETVHMSDFADYYPKDLSGGMKQRAAIARAFCYPSELLLMDEPFKALDMKLKSAVMDVFRQLWQENRKTVLFVTHDLDEAIELGHDIYVLSPPPVTIKKHFKADNQNKTTLRGEIIKYI